MTPYIRVTVFLCWAVHHVSMYFLGKAVFHFLLDEKRSSFLEKNTLFADKTKKIKRPYGAFWNNYLFWGPEENLIFLCIFKKRLSFILCLRCNIIFLGKGNIIFPDNTRKIMFQHVQGLWKRKICFSMQCIFCLKIAEYFDNI